MGDSLAILFHLKEQLHYNLDVLEENYFKLESYMGKKYARNIITEKKELIYALDIQTTNLMNFNFDSSELFNPISEPWTNILLFENSSSTTEIKHILDLFECKLLAWVSERIIESCIDKISYNILLEILIFSKERKDLLDTI